MVPPPCFKTNSKILCQINGQEVYVEIQNLKPNDLIKTTKGFKKLRVIGKRDIIHVADGERTKDKLYVCKPEKYPEVFEDLIITGCHSILVDSLKSLEQKQGAINVNGRLYFTDNKYRLPACVDDRTEIYSESGVHTIYHIALENEDYYSNYGVYANGLLVETCSLRYLIELSEMELIKAD